MGRGSGKAQWQTIELAACFKAGEAVCDQTQYSSKAVRQGRIREEFAAWLRKLNSDQTWIDEGYQFQDKVVGKAKIQWDIQASCVNRTPQDLTKKHKDLAAYCRKHISLPSSCWRPQAVELMNPSTWAELWRPLLLPEHAFGAVRQSGSTI